MTIEDKSGNITKELTLQHNKWKKENFTLPTNVTFKVGVLWKYSVITVASFHNSGGLSHSWECTGDTLCASSACNPSHVKWTKAYPCGLNLDWCSKFFNSTFPHLQWIWLSNNLTSNIWCREISSKLQYCMHTCIKSIM